jgi:AcrR family transcriptional regulator
MKDPKNNRKYIAIMETARELFWKFGFRRVTIDEICREAKTSKMTFYSFFPNKLELAKAVFDKQAMEGFEQFKSIMNEDCEPSLKMKKILQLKIDGTNNISSEFLNDFYNTPELGLKSYIDEKTGKIWAETIDLFREGQKKGWIRSDMNIGFMFYFMQSATPLLTDKVLLNMFNSPQELIIELANMFVYGISPKE